MVTQIIFGVLIVVVLVGLAAFYVWRQIQTLRRLRQAADLSHEERQYTHRQAWRRLLGSVLMLVLAGLMAGSLVLEGPANEHLKNEAPPDPARQQFWNFYSLYWIVTLLVLLSVIVLAALDLFAIRRFGKRQYRQIQEDRRAMIKDELTRLRSQRNGHT